MRVTPGSSVNSTSKRARSTWACGRGRLEANFERRDTIGPDAANDAPYGGVAASVSAIPQITPQPNGSKTGESRKPLAQIGQERISAHVR
jgi:hypothetical protein